MEPAARKILQAGTSTRSKNQVVVARKGVASTTGLLQGLLPADKPLPPAETGQTSAQECTAVVPRALIGRVQLG